MSDKHIEGNPWNNDVYKTVTFESDVVDDKTFEHFKYLAYREELRELLISAYPPLVYNMAGGTEAGIHLANVILAYGYHKQSEGEWKDRYKNKYANHYYECSVCGKPALDRNVDNGLGNPQQEQALSAYCPWCGSKMKGENDDSPTDT